VPSSAFLCDHLRHPAPAVMDPILQDPGAASLDLIPSVSPGPWEAVCLPRWPLLSAWFGLEVMGCLCRAELHCYWAMFRQDWRPEGPGGPVMGVWRGRRVARDLVAEAGRRRHCGGAHGDSA
jgi:hypothetical protein